MLRLMLRPNIQSLHGCIFSNILEQDYICCTSFVFCGIRLCGFVLLHTVAHDYTSCSTLPCYNVKGLFP
jgi:hypothetical protein